MEFSWRLSSTLGLFAERDLHLTTSTGFWFPNRQSVCGFCFLINSTSSCDGVEFPQIDSVEILKQTSVRRVANSYNFFLLHLCDSLLRSTEWNDRIWETRAKNKRVNWMSLSGIETVVSEDLAWLIVWAFVVSVAFHCFWRGFWRHGVVKLVEVP